MTVEELIRRLQSMPSEASVHIRAGDSSWAALMCGPGVLLQAEDHSGWGR